MVASFSYSKTAINFKTNTTLNSVIELHSVGTVHVIRPAYLYDFVKMCNAFRLVFFMYTCWLKGADRLNRNIFSVPIQPAMLNSLQLVSFKLEFGVTTTRQYLEH